MKLCVLSDLHLEHNPDWVLPVDDEAVWADHDVLIACGDIHSPPSRAIAELARTGRRTVYCSGNHEMYRRRCQPEEIRGISAAAASGNVSYLTGNPAGSAFVVIDGVRFVGGTLWTDFQLFGVNRTSLCADEARSRMNDYRQIGIETDKEAWKRLHPLDVGALHRRDLAAIVAVLEQPFAGPTVVVTHHAPHAASLDPYTKYDWISAAYASNLEAIILKHKPALWCHGHTHHPVDYMIGDTRVVSNPKGYGPHPKHGMHHMQVRDFSMAKGIIEIEVPTPEPEDEQTEKWQP